MHIRQVITTLSLLGGPVVVPQQPLDLHASLKKGDIEAYNRELSLIDEPGHAGIRPRG